MDESTFAPKSPEEDLKTLEIPFSRFRGKTQTTSKSPLGDLGAKRIFTHNSQLTI